MTIAKICAIFLLISAVCANPSKSIELLDDVEVINNGFKVEGEARGEKSLEDSVLGFVQSHDVKLKLPWDSAATVSARDIDNGIVNFKWKLPSSDEARGKKKKIKRVIFPIVALLVLKSITLLPLVLGILMIKAANAVNLGGITFITSFAVALYEIYKKFATNQPPPIVTHIAHGHDHHDIHDYHWDHHDHHRSFDDNAQQMAYNAYN